MPPTARRSRGQEFEPEETGRLARADEDPEQKEELSQADRLREILRRPLDANNEPIDPWDHIRSIPAELWGPDLYLYLYRIDSMGRAPYLTKYFHPVDPDFVKNGDDKEAGHGGGRYRLQLKSNELRCTMDSFEFEISGPPSIVSAAPVAPGPAPTDATAQVVDKVGELLKPYLRPDSNAAEVADAMRKGYDTVIEMVKEHATNPAADASSPIATVRQLLELMKGMMPAAAPANPVKDLAALASLLKELQPAQPAEGSIMGELRQALGEKLAERLLDLNGGGGEDWKATAAKAGLGLVEQLPTVIDKLATLQRSTPRTIEAQTVPVAAAPTLAAAPPTSAPQTLESPANVVTSPGESAVSAVSLEQLQDAAMRTIVSCFQKGRDGADTVMVLDELCEPIMGPLYEQMGKLPTALVIQWMKRQPQFAPIVGDPRLKEFVNEFRAELENWAQAQQKVPATEKEAAAEA